MKSSLSENGAVIAAPWIGLESVKDEPGARQAHRMTQFATMLTSLPGTTITLRTVLPSM